MSFEAGTACAEDARAVAYHFQKSQNADELIDIWGADHAGTVKRIKAAVAALTDGKNKSRRQAGPDGPAAQEWRAVQDVENARAIS